MDKSKDSEFVLNMPFRRADIQFSKTTSCSHIQPRQTPHFSELLIF